MASANELARGMPVVAALEVLIANRQANQVVVTNQASARIWPKLSQHALDLHYNPSTMGGAISLALGLALAQPSREVLVVSGDGSLLMSLGALVTVAAAKATNLSIVVLDNAMYEVTGGQKTPAAAAAVDLVVIARGAGIASAASFDKLADWQQRAPEVARLPGPRFISLKVQPTPQEFFLGGTPALAEQLERLCQALETTA